MEEMLANLDYYIIWFAYVGLVVFALFHLYFLVLRLARENYSGRVFLRGYFKDNSLVNWVMMLWLVFLLFVVWGVPPLEALLPFVFFGYAAKEYKSVRKAEMPIRQAARGRWVFAVVAVLSLASIAALGLVCYLRPILASFVVILCLPVLVAGVNKIAKKIKG